MLVKCSVARILYYPYKFPSGKFLSLLKRENRHARISRLPSRVVRTPFRPILDVTLLPSSRQLIAADERIFLFVKPPVKNVVAAAEC